MTAAGMCGEGASWKGREGWSGPNNREAGAVQGREGADHVLGQGKDGH